MDYEHTNDFSQQPSQPSGTGPGGTPPPPQYIYAAPPPPPKKRTGWRIFWGIILSMSIVANIVLFLMLVAVAVTFATGRVDGFMHEVLQSGPSSAKIAVINIRGIIDDDQARNLHAQMKMAEKDGSVRGLILRVVSPGGTVSASDQIHNEITRFREQTGRPVVAFMQGIAASGGYYTSVACDKIVAEPTAITGSIGVIMQHLVIEKLLEQKLGIEPYVIKSGQKKDWPSLFSEPSQEELEYLQEKIITPVYERFVEIVDNGRPDLSLAEVKKLADGGIYPAQEALDEKLIDKVAYIDGAIEEVKALAGIKEALVIQYKKMPSVLEMLMAESRSKNILNLDRSTIYELTTPEVMYLWRGHR